MISQLGGRGRIRDVSVRFDDSVLNVGVHISVCIYYSVSISVCSVSQKINADIGSSVLRLQ